MSIDKSAPQGRTRQDLIVEVFASIQPDSKAADAKTNADIAAAWRLAVGLVDGTLPLNDPAILPNVLALLEKQRKA